MSETSKGRKTLQKIKLVMSKMNLSYSLKKYRRSGGNEIDHIKVEILPSLAVWPTKCSDNLCLYLEQGTFKEHFWVHNSTQAFRE